MVFYKWTKESQKEWEKYRQDKNIYNNHPFFFKHMSDFKESEENKSLGKMIMFVFGLVFLVSPLLFYGVNKLDTLISNSYNLSKYEYILSEKNIDIDFKEFNLETLCK